MQGRKEKPALIAKGRRRIITKAPFGWRSILIKEDGRLISNTTL